MEQTASVSWCRTCQSTAPCNHERTDVWVVPVPEDGQSLARFANLVEQDASLWQDYEKLVEQGFPFGDFAAMVRNLDVFAAPILIRRLLHFHHLTQQIRDVPGAWLEFGVAYGRDLVWWHILKTLETHRHAYTRIAGFDTWEGHTGTSPVDGGSKHVQEGAFATPPGYEHRLRQVLGVLEWNFPVSPEIVLLKGDVRDTLPEWLDNNTDIPVAFVYLDLDLYEPTRYVLEQIRPRMVKGGIVGFDEFGSTLYPGEGRAIVESFGYGCEFRRSPYGDWTYLVV